MNSNTQYIINWIGRMTVKYGGAVYEKDKYYPWDWGQALARECYGPGWNEVVPNDPSSDDVLVAKEWLNGNFPECFPKWVDTERTFMILREEQ